MEIRDKKGLENIIVDYLSRLEREDYSNHALIDDSFADEFILALEQIFSLWYADFANYLAGAVLLEDLLY